jgi:hypothetical protein
MPGGPAVDLAVGSADSAQLSLLQGDGHGGFTLRPPITIAADGGGINDIVVADIDGDGKLDVIVSQPATNRVIVARGDGQYGFAPAGQATLDALPARLVVRDVNGDGHADVIVATANGVAILQGDGDGHLTAAGEIAAATRVSDVAVEELTGDGDLDLVVAEPDLNRIEIYAGDGAGQFNLSGAVSGSHPSALVAGDFTGDGEADVVVANAGDATLTLFVVHAGVLDPAQTVANGVPATRLVRADLNADGRADLLALDSPTGTLRILEGVGDGSFRIVAVLVLTGQGPTVGVAVADFNSDRLPDLASGAPAVGQVLIGTNTSPVEVRPGDLTRDGRVDAKDIAQLFAELFDGDGADAASAAGGSVLSGGEADVNGDGGITATDATSLLQRLTR